MLHIMQYFRECTGYGTLQMLGKYRNRNIFECLLIGNVPSLYTPKLGQIQDDEKLEWTRTELNCFDKLTEVRNFTSGLTECTGDGVYICITSGGNGFEGLTSGRTSRAAPSQLKTVFLASHTCNMYLFCLNLES